MTVLYSLLHLCLGIYRLLTGSPITPSRSQAWLCFIFDQVRSSPLYPFALVVWILINTYTLWCVCVCVQLFSYLIMSAGSAGIGVTNLNKTGIKHTPLPDFCKTLSYFCNHVALSLLLVLLSFIFLASSSLFNVLVLSTL